MHNITISAGGEAITMPTTRKLTVGGEEVCRDVVMASGKMVKEMQGHRAVVSASWDWVPAETMTALHMLLRRGGFFTVTYSDPGEGEVTGRYSIKYPQSRIFKFTDDGAVWHEVSLTMHAQEVV